MDADEDLDVDNLSIPLTGLARMFDCPVCYERINSCMMTPCGHNFCAACVDECLNRKHQVKMWLASATVLKIPHFSPKIASVPAATRPARSSSW